jgi:predicted alpha/beta superfamily hydrolase
MSNTHPPVALPGTEVRLLQSSNVDQEYKLFISLPSDYDESKDSYPVLYVTDANWFFSSFPLLRWLPIPPMIIVGIGYPTDDSAEISRIRARDFLPTQNKEDEKIVKEEYEMSIESGGGHQFLSFIRDELFPFINDQYRTNPDDRALFGYSYGGTFGLFTLFNKPDTFNRYILGAPDLGWDNELCFQYEQQYAAKQSDLPVKLFFAVGTLDEAVIMDRNVSTLFRLHAILKSRNYEGLDMSLKILEGETHPSAIVPTASWGLRVVFG